MMNSNSPVYNIVPVPIEKIEPNDYNPNAVAPPELRLLYDSIEADGYTMPVVCYYDQTRDVDLMSNIISELHELGRSDAWISKHLGMDKDEILRLKQITGLAALFREVDFGKAWGPVEDNELIVLQETAVTEDAE